MHSIHSLAHRAPTATRTKVRWQPYASIDPSPSITSRSPPISYLSTPTSISSSSPLSASTPSLSQECTKQASACLQQIPKEAPSQKNKFALGLVDQTIKCLSDMWRIQDVPPVFLNSTKTGTFSSSEDLFALQRNTSSTLFSHFNKQLPSPVSPKTLFTSPTTSTSTHCTSQIPDEVPIASQANATTQHIKGFVHEVLRRSRTSGCVLQTALCYLEAIRPKVNELVHLEKIGQGKRGEPESRAIIIEDEYEILAEDQPPTPPLSWEEDTLIATVKVSDADPDVDTFHKLPITQQLGGKPLQKQHSAESIPPSQLPSPLLCPRRAFLASLILASKFTQDKCYSNRAWAKLSGLPPREIGRCERALGDALDWRLWVGKSSASPAQFSSSSETTPSRTLSRCHSESELRKAPKAPFLVKTESSSGRCSSSLRRCSTVPTEIFASQAGQAPSSASTSTLRIDSPMATVPTISCSFAPKDLSNMYSSPIPETPNLTNSPTSSSSGSSIGERTIQMTNFSDDSVGGQDVWSWSDYSPQTMPLASGGTGAQVPQIHVSSPAGQHVPAYNPAQPYQDFLFAASGVPIGQKVAPGVGVGPFGPGTDAALQLQGYVGLEQGEMMQWAVPSGI